LDGVLAKDKALKSDVMSGIVENRIAVSPLEMRVSAQ
jgi:hypothetical protein